MYWAQTKDSKRGLDNDSPSSTIIIILLFLLPRFLLLFSLVNDKAQLSTRGGRYHDNALYCAQVPYCTVRSYKNKNTAQETILDTGVIRVTAVRKARHSLGYF